MPDLKIISFWDSCSCNSFAAADNWNINHIPSFQIQFDFKMQSLTTIFWLEIQLVGQNHLKSAPMPGLSMSSIAWRYNHYHTIGF